MPKSNYPNKLDTSVEIPVVRDNITEIGSDVLNSLRSAIFNIEKALGINPQGAVGGTVATRLSNALDESGNIKKEALDRANILSGPVINADVSSVAAIKESKLSLDFPTQLLQDEISYVNAQIDDIIQKIIELNAIISTHVHEDATNRHKALAISVESDTGNPSDIATKSLEDDDLQDTLERLYDEHINYTGLNISSTNNSHLANQIYYDNEEVIDILPDIDVQSAITTLAGLGASGIRDFILNLSSNGIVRTGSIVDNYEGNDLGDTIVSKSAITYTAGHKSSTIIIFSEHPEVEKDITEFDILTISNAINEEDDGSYRIKSFLIDPHPELSYVEIYGTLKEDSETGTTATITKSIYRAYNENGLNCAVRPRALKTNTPEIQVANPNAATIISKGISPSELSIDNHIIGLSIDGGDNIDIETYDDALIEQSLDSVVHKINEQCIEHHLNCLAYKLRVKNCYELAITHNVPNIVNDFVNRTLKVTVGSENDGLTQLGLSHVDEIEYEGAGGNTYHINGYLYNTFGRIQTFTNEELTITYGTPRLAFVSGSASDYDIRIGDLLVVSGSSESGDDGTYRIESITDSSIYVDDSSVTFDGELEDDTSIIYVIRCTAPVGELTFTEVVSPEGQILFDVFLDDNRNVFFRKRLEVDGNLIVSGFSAGVIDVSRNFIVEDEDAILSFVAADTATTPPTPATLTLTDPLGQVGGPVVINMSGVYKIFSADMLSYVIVQVYMSADPIADMDIGLVGFNDIAYDNLYLCRGVFSTSLGYVFGAPDVEMGVPVVVDKRNTGTVDKTIISENILEKYIQGPRNELRGSGVIRGCEILNHLAGGTDETLSDGTVLHYETVDISSGVLVVNGMRIEYTGETDFRINTTENFYIGIDALGCVVYGESTDLTDPFDFPFKDIIVALLAYVDVSISSTTDLRLFVDHIDYKYLGDITVSNDQYFGHFTSISKAVDYARMFKGIFPDTGIPSILIKEGTYYIEDTIYIDFDTVIRGVGPGTIIQRSGDLLNSLHGPVYYSIFHIGGIPSDDTDHTTWLPSDNITYGVTLENFTYKMSEDYSGTTSVINLQQNIDASPSSCFRFSNINFEGREDLVLSDGHDGSKGLYEFALRVGRGADEYFGNVIFSNNFTNWMGYGDGAVYLDNYNFHNNIIVTNNISLNVYGETGVQSTDGCGIISNFVWTSSSTLTGIVEASNVSDDQ